MMKLLELGLEFGVNVLIVLSGSVKCGFGQEQGRGDHKQASFEEPGDES